MVQKNTSVRVSSFDAETTLLTTSGYCIHWSESEELHVTDIRTKEEKIIAEHNAPILGCLEHDNQVVAWDAKNHIIWRDTSLVTFRKETHSHTIEEIAFNSGVWYSIDSKETISLWFPEKTLTYTELISDCTPGNYWRILHLVWIREQW